jgi:putative ATP-binding cassette transporter
LAWKQIIKQQGIVTLVLNTDSVLFPIIPLLLAAPKYMNGSLTLGAVMQIVAAFSAVQGALIWFVDNVVRLAEWYASVQRVSELTFSLRELDQATLVVDDNHIVLKESDDDAIHLDNLSIAELGGRIVIKEASIKINKGEKVFINGESGVGKSTLIRAIAGLWPWGVGEISIPKDASIAFIPQRPYLPLGSLRDAISYPRGADDIEPEIIHKAMQRCGLGYLIRKLDVVQRWDQTLSGGERQRVGFCRLVIQKPKIIIMDEATSALDEDSQHSLLSLFHEDLKDSTVISVGHHSAIEEFHERKITIERQALGARMISHPLRKTLWHMFIDRTL